MLFAVGEQVIQAELFVLLQVPDDQRAPIGAKVADIVIADGIPDDGADFVRAIAEPDETPDQLFDAQLHFFFLHKYLMVIIAWLNAISRKLPPTITNY